MQHVQPHPASAHERRAGCRTSGAVRVPGAAGARPRDPARTARRPVPAVHRGRPHDLPRADPRRPRRCGPNWTHSPVASEAPASLKTSARDEVAPGAEAFVEHRIAAVGGTHAQSEPHGGRWHVTVPWTRSATHRNDVRSARRDVARVSTRPSSAHRTRELTLAVPCPHSQPPSARPSAARVGGPSDTLPVSLPQSVPGGMHRVRAAVPLLNARPVPPGVHHDVDRPIPVTVTLRWATGVEVVDTVALEWTRTLVRVRIADLRVMTGAVWVPAEDVRRQQILADAAVRDTGPNPRTAPPAPPMPARTRTPSTGTHRPGTRPLGRQRSRSSRTRSSRSAEMRSPQAARPGK